MAGLSPIGDLLAEDLTTTITTESGALISVGLDLSSVVVLEVLKRGYLLSCTVATTHIHVIKRDLSFT